MTLDIVLLQFPEYDNNKENLIELLFNYYTLLIYIQVFVTIYITMAVSKICCDLA